MAVQAISANDLARLRRDAQWSKLFLAIHQPNSVYTARVNQTFPTIDSIASVVYDTGAGNLADVLVGMTIYVGTSAGADDVGRVRVRATPSGTIFYIGETSEIAWANDLYLTVVDEIGLWARHPTIVSGDQYQDFSIAYSNQHDACAPYPVMGPDAVLVLRGAPGTVTFNAGASFALGSSISTYSWAAPGSTSVSGGSTATPTITYSSPGTYRVACTVTAANGASHTGYRYVFVYSESAMPAHQFQLESLAGTETGWRFRVKLFSSVPTTTLRDQAQVILFAEDFYGTERISLGPVGGRENILATGWIIGESIEWGDEYGTVSFEVAGAAEWLGAMIGFPVGIEDTEFSDNGGGAADRWTEFENLTTDRALWHILHWRSTCSLRVDAFLTGDTRQTPSVNSASSTLWAQLSETVAPIMGQARCDRYNGLYFYIDPQLVPTGDRSGFTNVMTLTAADWGDRITFERRQVGDTAQLNLSGIAYAEGAAIPYCARATGTVFKRYARSVQTVDRLLLVDQAQATQLAGLMLGRANNPYPSLGLTLVANNRFFDVAPPSYILVNMAASDTPRDITFTNKRFLLRRVSLNWNAAAQTFTTTLEAEAENFGDLGLSTPCPGIPAVPEQQSPVVFSPTFPIAPTTPYATSGVVISTSNAGVFATTNLAAGSPTWVARNTGLPTFVGVYYPMRMAQDSVNPETVCISLDGLQIITAAPNQTSIFRTTGLLAGANWISMVTKGNLETLFGMSLDRITVGQVRAGVNSAYMAAMAYVQQSDGLWSNFGILRSSDRGATWALGDISTFSFPGEYALDEFSGSAGGATFQFRTHIQLVGVSDDFLNDISFDAGTGVDTLVTYQTRYLLSAKATGAPPLSFGFGWAAGDSNVYRINDAFGTTADTLLDMGVGVSGWAIGCNASGTIVALQSSDSVFRVSTDGGNSWTVRTGPGFRIRAMKPLDGNSWIAVGDSGNVAITTDITNPVWTSKIGTGIPGTTDVLDVIVIA